nr:MAG TPA: YopX protein [Caudoviricetes sp.]
MIPKFRAWLKKEQEMDNEIDHISWLEDELYCIGDGITYMVLAEDLVLMQSTGLKDKNGKEIFEGDVVSIDTDEFDLLFVKYESGIYWLMDDEECVEHLSDYYKYVSIVGNIYENPELLEVGK